MIIVGQILGFIYLIIFVISFQFKKLETLMKIRIVSKIIATLHYLFLSAYSGAVSQFISIFPNYFSYKYQGQKKNKIIAFLFIIIFFISGILTYQNIYDTLPIIGSILTVIAIFQINTKYVRLFQLIISPFFLVYNIVSHSYAGIIMEILVVISCLIGMMRLDKSK